MPLSKGTMMSVWTVQVSILVSLINFIFWNCRGTGSKIFLNTIKILTNIHHLDFLSIFEPCVSGDRATRIINKLGFSNYFVEDARGFAGDYLHFVE